MLVSGTRIWFSWGGGGPQGSGGGGSYLVPLYQQRFEAGDLGPQLADELDVGVLVDRGLVDDVLGAVGVAQGAQRLAVVHVGRGNG